MGALPAFVCSTSFVSIASVFYWCGGLADFRTMTRSPSEARIGLGTRRYVNVLGLHH